MDAYTFFVAKCTHIGFNQDVIDELFIASMDEYGKEHYSLADDDAMQIIPWSDVTVLYRGYAQECFDYFDDIR